MLMMKKRNEQALIWGTWVASRLLLGGMIATTALGVMAIAVIASPVTAVLGAVALVVAAGGITYFSYKGDQAFGKPFVNSDPHQGSARLNYFFKGLITGLLRGVAGPFLFAFQALSSSRQPTPISSAVPANPASKPLAGKKLEASSSHHQIQKQLPAKNEKKKKRVRFDDTVQIREIPTRDFISRIEPSAPPAEHSPEFDGFEPSAPPADEDQDSELLYPDLSGWRIQT